MTVRRFNDLPPVEVRGEALNEPVMWLGLQWAVTPYGLEKRDGTYYIEHPRFLEDPHMEGHIGRKDWVDIQDLGAAFAFARSLKPQDWPQTAKPARAGSMPLIDAYMAWCPKSEAYTNHPRFGQIVVGTMDEIERELDKPNRLPSWTGVCAGTGPRTTPEARVITMFSNFAALVVRDGLDPQDVHRAFLQVDEYRAHVPEDMPR